MSDDDLRDLARALREAAGHELRADASEVEQLTELQRRRRADLAAVARAAMHRGDGVVARVAGLTLAHPVVAVGLDYLVMESDDATIDVRLEAAVLTAMAQTSGGGSGVPESSTLRARLAEHEYEEDEVEVVTATGDRVRGVIEVAASDHVVVADGAASTIVPMIAVAVVFSRLRPRRR